MKQLINCKEISDATYIIKLMREEWGKPVFGHRVISVSKKDTKSLKHKLNLPITNKDKEDYVDTVSRAMDKLPQYAKYSADKHLDAALDLDTRVSRSDYEDHTSDASNDDDEVNLDGVDISDLEV